jgi:hypothetical protein
MCSGARRALFQLSIAMMLGATVLAAPNTDDSQGSQADFVRSASTVTSLGATGPTLADEAVMVLAGAILIGVAAAVRRAA